MDKQKVRSIRGLIVFSACMILLLMYSQNVYRGIRVIIGFCQPFIIGGAIAFILNIPMRAVEKAIFGKRKKNGKHTEMFNKMSRPVSILLTLMIVVLVFTIVIVTVVPQLTRTVVEVGNKIPPFLDAVIDRLEELCASNPQILAQLNELENLEFDWQAIFTGVGNFLKTGVGSMLNSTFSVASNIIGSIVNIIVAFIFSIYLLSQKEKLCNQCKRFLHAYTSEKINEKILKVLELLNKNFGSFISGQCTEAVILGSMFVIMMTILRLPYALLIGVLITFTALIPIVGAFIGCGVGTFLILMEDPVKAFWFLILFLVLQQVEGNFIYPHVVGNSVGLPSIWVLAAVSIGGSLMGVLGMLIFIPLVSTAYALIRDDVNERNRKKKKAKSNMKIIEKG